MAIAHKGDVPASCTVGASESAATVSRIPTPWRAELQFGLPVIMAGRVKVADVMAPKAKRDTPEGRAEIRAKSLLLASAPELLAALKGVFEYYMGPHACGDFTCNCGRCGLCDMRVDISMVIKRAEGRAE